mgnify:CR=1 FL=1
MRLINKEHKTNTNKNKSGREKETDVSRETHKIIKQIHENKDKNKQVRIIKKGNKNKPQISIEK